MHKMMIDIKTEQTISLEEMLNIEKDSLRAR